MLLWVSLGKDTDYFPCSQGWALCLVTVDAGLCKQPRWFSSWGGDVPPHGVLCFVFVFFYWTKLLCFVRVCCWHLWSGENGRKWKLVLTDGALPRICCLFGFPKVFEGPIWPRFSQNFRVFPLLNSGGTVKGFVSQGHTERVPTLHSFQMAYARAAPLQHSLQSPLSFKTAPVTPLGHTPLQVFIAKQEWLTRLCGCHSFVMRIWAVYYLSERK